MIAERRRQVIDAGTFAVMAIAVVALPVLGRSHAAQDAGASQLLDFLHQRLRRLRLLEPPVAELALVAQVDHPRVEGMRFHQLQPDRLVQNGKDGPAVAHKDGLDEEAVFVDQPGLYQRGGQLRSAHLTGALRWVAG